ncbi:MAG: hypothetical protein ISS63_10525 [Desulfobacteraceae bacterium]|nr:hypothetical protein [Desulfobacteraceae bacterium]
MRFKCRFHTYFSTKDVPLFHDIKIFRMHRLGIPQERIAKKLGIVRTSIQYHLSKMPALANSTNTDLSRGFTVAQVAEKHGWAEPMVWFMRAQNPVSLSKEAEFF